MENLFIKGGIFMWPLLIALFITLVITLERWLYWLKTKLENNSGFKKAFIESKNSCDLLASIDGNHSDPVINMACQALRSSQLSKAEIEILLQQKQLSHNRFMRLLDVTISVAPLLGILGTIWGIISSFNLVSVVKEIDPSTAMLGISEAFITTAFGLIVSLLALFAFNYFQSLSEKELTINDIFLTKLLITIKSNE